jgi:MFS family permease
VLGLATALVDPPSVALLAAALLLGLGNAPNVPAGSRILARTAPPEHRTLIFSVKQAGAPLGGMIAGLTLPPLAATLDWPASLLLVAMVLLVSALLVQPLRARLDADRDSARAISPRALLAPANLAAPFAALRLHPLLVPLTALCFAFAIATGCLFALLVTFLVEARGLTLAQAGLAFAAMQAAGLVARLLLGWLGDRTGSGRAAVPTGKTGARLRPASTPRTFTLIL